MELVIEPEAEDDLKEQEKEHKDYILGKLEELRERPAGHQDSSTIEVKGNQVFKYRMKEKDRGGKDYRAVYDIRDGKIKVIAIFHRDRGYNKEKILKRL